MCPPGVGLFFKAWYKPFAAATLYTLQVTWTSQSFSFGLHIGRTFNSLTFNSTARRGRFENAFSPDRGQHGMYNFDARMSFACEGIFALLVVVVTQKSCKMRMFDSTTPQSNHEPTCPHAGHKHAHKSWHSDVPIILPGWGRHAGGSRSKPAVHPCSLRGGGCVLLTDQAPQHTTTTTDEPTTLHMRRQILAW